jgi:hypothetical protein
MEPEFIFRDTAFKHNLDEADIRHAVPAPLLLSV